METIGDRVKKAREAINMTRPQLAAASGVGYSTLSELERGGMQTSTKLRVIADALGVSLSWLETGRGEKSPQHPHAPEVKTIEVAEWEVRRKLGYLPKPGRIQIITGRGPSMKPKLEDGDIVWIDTSCDYFDGDDYYLINIGGETQIKMLQKRGDGLYVVSVNTDFPAYRPDPGDVSILGKALIHAGLRKF